MPGISSNKQNANNKGQFRGQQKKNIRHEN